MRPSAPRKDVLSAMDGNSRPLHKPTSCNNAVLDTEVPPMMSKSARQNTQRRNFRSGMSRRSETDYNTV